MDPLIRIQVERLHASPIAVVVAVAGGGANALAWLLGTPGASRTILEALVPYAPYALADFLGYRPGQMASLDTARDMARTAYERARRLAPPGVPIVGVGCTAALATDRPRRGEHRCFVAAWTERAATGYGVTLVKGLRDREREDEIASRLVVRALAEASGVRFDLPLTLDDRERVEVVTVDNRDLIQRLLDGNVSTVTVRSDGGMVADEAVRGGLLSGSFHPFHEGHESLAGVAAAILEANVLFELSVTNVDKTPLELGEVRERLAQFAGKRTVVVTRAPTFHEKARLFPGCAFVIGWDTALRVVDPRYYSGSESEMMRALADIRKSGCRFLVAGREEGGVFHTLRDVPVPVGFEDIFSAIPEAAFRCDISSTTLRATDRRY